MNFYFWLGLAQAKQSYITEELQMWHTYLGGTLIIATQGPEAYKVAQNPYNKTPLFLQGLHQYLKWEKQISTYQRFFVLTKHNVFYGYNHQIKSMLSRLLEIARKNEKNSSHS